jgi:hypothetical protein
VNHGMARKFNCSDTGSRKERSSGIYCNDLGGKETRESGIRINDRGASEFSKPGFADNVTTRRIIKESLLVDQTSACKEKNPMTMGRDGNFSSPGGSFSGPVLADVEKSMKGVQEQMSRAGKENTGDVGKKWVTWKRKMREEEMNESLAITHEAQKKRGLGNERKGKEGDKISLKKERNNSLNGLRLAEVDFQPRQPQ